MSPHTSADQINARAAQGLINKPSGPIDIDQNFDNLSIDTGGGPYTRIHGSVSYVARSAVNIIINTLPHPPQTSSGWGQSLRVALLAALLLALLLALYTLGWYVGQQSTSHQSDDRCATVALGNSVRAHPNRGVPWLVIMASVALRVRQARPFSSIAWVGQRPHKIRAAAAVLSGVVGLPAAAQAPALPSWGATPP